MAEPRAYLSTRLRRAGAQLRHAAELAMTLAEAKVRDRMTSEAQESLVKGFVQNLQ